MVLAMLRYVSCNAHTYVAHALRVDGPACSRVLGSRECPRPAHVAQHRTSYALHASCHHRHVPCETHVNTHRDPPVTLLCVCDPCRSRVCAHVLTSANTHASRVYACVWKRAGMCPPAPHVRYSASAKPFARASAMAGEALTTAAQNFALPVMRFGSPVALMCT